MEDQYYEIADLSNYIMNGGRANFQRIPVPAVPDLLLSGRPAPAAAQNYSDSVLLDRTVVTGGGYNPDFRPDSTISGYGGCYGGFEFMEAGGTTGRWPRQETLTLLEIRSRLDSKFKESTQKGPLWDEVSRIMSEEHGYQRTGKKCREKFDNLYKYYKKTRDGKSGRHEGKNYRFFRQLEALYGDSKNAASFSGPENNQESLDPLKLSTADHSISISKTSDFYSDGLNMLDDDGPCENSKGKKIKNKKKWKAKVEEFIDSEMRNLMEKQDDWLLKMTKMIEDKEQERLLKEKEWKKLEESRIEREQNFWATQKSWIEGRNVALMEAMRNLTGKDLQLYPPNPQDLKQYSSNTINTTDHVKETTTRNLNNWLECEITCLIQLRTSMESRFHQQIEEEEGLILWEEVAAKMAYLGYDRNASMCKDKWDSINKNKRKEEDSSRAYCCYTTLQNDEYINSQMGVGIYSSAGGNIIGHGIHQYVSLPDDRGGDGCYRSMVGAAETMWLKDP